MKNLAQLERELLTYLQKTGEIPGTVFSGPSLYFHEEAIKEARMFLSKQHVDLSQRHLELIYAVLPSWGMHRMGGGKKKGQKTAKVVDFVEFQGQIQGIKPELETLKDPQNATVSFPTSFRLLTVPIRYGSCGKHT
jgi:hypothetical protein